MLALISCVILGQFAADPADPVPGNPAYLPRFGEKAIMYRFDSRKKEAQKTFTGFLDVEAVIEFEEKRQAYIAEHPAQQDPDAADAAGQKILDEYKSEKKAVSLAAKTGVEVVGYGNFNRALEDLRPSDNKFYQPLVAEYLVKVLDGPHKGKLVWVSIRSVRVPGSKPFEPFALTEASPPLKKAEPQPKPSKKAGYRAYNRQFEAEQAAAAQAQREYEARMAPIWAQQQREAAQMQQRQYETQLRHQENMDFNDAIRGVTRPR